ncbi:hypothetical protein CMUS01_04790 [Colletotrichum musicola]|uniref:Uncharacterized protein n=1 Tax=Colletotrichum musicola TaxID=2175873 RepID=A0A8H6KUR0_9PEZI|nr:hypothetical protein CMUS01_04790 [Colletotrichum musicola]
MSGRCRPQPIFRWTSLTHPEPFFPPTLLQPVSITVQLDLTVGFDKVTSPHSMPPPHPNSIHHDHASLSVFLSLDMCVRQRTGRSPLHYCSKTWGSVTTHRAARCLIRLSTSMAQPGAQRNSCRNGVNEGPFGRMGCDAIRSSYYKLQIWGSCRDALPLGSPPHALTSTSLSPRSQTSRHIETSSCVRLDSLLAPRLLLPAEQQLGTAPERSVVEILGQPC